MVPVQRDIEAGYVTSNIVWCNRDAGEMCRHIGILRAIPLMESILKLHRPEFVDQKAAIGSAADRKEHHEFGLTEAVCC
jgi:hypothetical protein